MRLSIILATANRHLIIEKSIESIQSIECGYGDSIQLVVVDQSFDDKSFSLLKKYESGVDLIYIHALKRGLSHSRNLGLEHADGDVLCFGDDDCFYDRKLIANLNRFFSQHSCDFLSVGVYEPFSDTLTRYTKFKNSKSLNERNVFGRITSISLFLKNTALLSTFRFNEHLGLGAEFGSCEEIDYVYRILENGFIGIYEPSIRVYHENPSGYSREKTYSYALGHGAFTRILFSKLTLSSIYCAIIKLFKAILKIPAQLLVKKKLYPFQYLSGFIYGFFNWGKSK